MPNRIIPDMIISEDREREILAWLYQEITTTLKTRDPLEDHWLDIQEYYEKTELEEKRNFPFEGAAHLMVPLMPMYVQQIKAKILETLFAPSDPFSITPFNPDLAKVVKPFRKFITWATREELKTKQHSKMSILEYLKLGNTVTKTIWKHEVRTYKKWNENTEEFETITQVVANHPEHIQIPLPDYLFPLESSSQDDMRWEAHRFRLTWAEVVRRHQNGEYTGDIEAIKTWALRGRSNYQENREQVGPQLNLIPENDEFEFWEVWFTQTVEAKLEDNETPKATDPPQRMVWVIHLESQATMRKRYNFYPMQLTPFDIMGYEPAEHRVYANGVGNMVLPFQKEISTMHNQRLDSVTIRNAPMFLRKRDTLAPREVLFRAGGIIPVDEMDDMKVLFQGSSVDSTIQDEQQTLSLLQQRLGMQDFQGQQALANAQATSVLAVMAESARRFDDTLDEVRDFLSRIMMKALLLYNANYPEGKTYMVLGQEDGAYVEEVWKFPEEWIYSGLGLSLTATTSSTSKELERQNKLSLFSLMSQYYGNLSQYLVQATSGQLPPLMAGVMLQIVDGFSTMVEDILEDFDIHNSAELAISLADLQQQAQAAGAQGAPSQPPGPPGVGPAGGVPPGGPAGPGGQASQGGGQG